MERYDDVVVSRLVKEVRLNDGAVLLLEVGG